ncbi:PEP/pyruvate-binding domain-containing protein [Megalodesulfovibrio paquesii]
MADAPLHQIISSAVKRLLPAHRRKAATARADRQAFFRARYQAFLQLLESNTELLNIISELETRHAGGELVGLAQLRQLATRAMFHGLRMIASFETLSGKPQPELRSRMDAIRDRLTHVLANPEHLAEALAAPAVLSLAALHRELVDIAGAKAANLGELHGRLGLPTPDGFAVTVAGFRQFIQENALDDVIRLCISIIQPGDPASHAEASRSITEAMLESPLPRALEQAMLDAFDACAARLGLAPEDLRVAVRSSALGEDGELSHAGQYLSVLHVARDQLCQAWRRVAASLYSPQALSYLLQHGLSLDGLAMCTACIQMVDAQSSGVMYTRHPWGLGRRALYINAVWGLGAFAVEGRVQPDVYILDADSGMVLQERLGSKTSMLTRRDDALVELETPAALRALPCLLPEQLQGLTRAAQALERHFGQPQDVEWAVDPAGSLQFLQSRPLGQSHQTDADFAGLQDCSLPLLAEGGDAACPGLAAGPVFLSATPEDAANVPEGAILVARHSSPGYTALFPRLAGVITEHGSVTGHMASVSREFGLPTLVGLPDAMTRLPSGRPVTLDAWSRRVHAGLHPEALEAQRQARESSARASCSLDAPTSPARAALQTLRREVVPLTLTDPKAQSFAPEHCRTLHDIMRFLHEKSYGVMFAISDHAAGTAGGKHDPTSPDAVDEGFALPLDGTTGLDLYIIDLGGGLTETAHRRHRVPVQDVVSRPFRALLQGLILDPQTQGPRPVHLKGFLSVLGEQLVGEHHLHKERFGDRSYAIISDKYLNFSSRVGYHYGVLDCYCGRTVNKNYITFSFKGGAADEQRRSRRARGIALILERLGFQVETTGDRVAGRFQKYDAAKIEAVLVQMGRLLQYTRQVDMLMTGESSVQALADCFFTGACYFEPSAL